MSATEEPTEVLTMVLAWLEAGWGARQDFVSAGRSMGGVRGFGLESAGQRLSGVGGHERTQARVAPCGHAGANTPW
jgi:hypothetical protein